MNVFYMLIYLLPYLKVKHHMELISISPAASKEF